MLKLNGDTHELQDQEAFAVHDETPAILLHEPCDCWLRCDDRLLDRADPFPAEPGSFPAARPSDRFGVDADSAFKLPDERSAAPAHAPTHVERSARGDVHAFAGRPGFVVFRP